MITLINYITLLQTGKLKKKLITFSRTFMRGLCINNNIKDRFIKALVTTVLFFYKSDHYLLMLFYNKLLILTVYYTVSHNAMN